MIGRMARLIAVVALCWPLAAAPARAGAPRGRALCRITGYVATGYRTATGVWPRLHHTVAVNPALIPYGSRVRIAGLPWTYRAEDSGAFGWAHIDVFVGSVAEAYAITSTRACRWW